MFLYPEEKTKDYGRLVHKLLSQHMEGERAWVEKYPTSRHVPMVGADGKLLLLFVLFFLSLFDIKLKVFAQIPNATFSIQHSRLQSGKRN